MIGGSPVFEDVKEMVAYAKDRKNSPQMRFKCPSCGRVRVLKRQYVLRPEFARTKYKHCLHCTNKPAIEQLPGHVKIRCSRCQKIRQIKRTSYRDKSYSRFCLECSKIEARKKEANNEWKRSALARLPETCNPARDPRHPSGNRQYFCRHYDECLDVCLAKAWPGFVCSECSGGELEPLEQRMLPWSTIMEVLHDSV